MKVRATTTKIPSKIAGRRSQAVLFVCGDLGLGYGVGGAIPVVEGEHEKLDTSTYVEQSSLNR